MQRLLVAAVVLGSVLKGDSVEFGLVDLLFVQFYAHCVCRETRDCQLYWEGNHFHVCDFPRSHVVNARHEREVDRSISEEAKPNKEPPI